MFWKGIILFHENILVYTFSDSSFFTFFAAFDTFPDTCKGSQHSNFSRYLSVYGSIFIAPILGPLYLILIMWLVFSWLNFLLNSNVKLLCINIFRLAVLLWWVEIFDNYIETLRRKASIYQVVDSGTMLNIEWMVICAF